MQIKRIDKRRIKERRENSLQLSRVLSRYQSRPPTSTASLDDMRREISERLDTFVQDCLNHGSIRVSAYSHDCAPGLEPLLEGRFRALTVLDIWRRVEAVEAARIPVNTDGLPCKWSADAYAGASVGPLRSALRAYKTHGTVPTADEAAAMIAAAEAASPWEDEDEDEDEDDEMTDEELALRLLRNDRLAAAARTASHPFKDALWREAKRRRWTRKQLMEAFE